MTGTGNSPDLITTMLLADATLRSSLLTTCSWVAVGTAVFSACWIVFDIVQGHRQHMWIMNVVWPITALWAGPAGLWAYFKIGRSSTRQAVQRAKSRGSDPAMKQHSMWISTALAATHCGSGCTLADIFVEWFLFLVPAISIAGINLKFELFGHKIFAAWVIDYVVALLIGITFQYFTIQPMRQLPPGKALGQALKADTLSLTAWQAGMYGWMAIAVFLLFGHELSPSNPVFWFMMQIAMLCGFLTAYPINWWLIETGVKEKM